MKSCLILFFSISLLFVSCKEDPVISEDQSNNFLKVFGGSSSDSCSAVIQSGNQFYMTGCLNYPVQPGMCLIITDKYGNEIDGGAKVFVHDQMDSQGNDIVMDPDKNIIMAGATLNTPTGGDSSRIYVVKTDAAGNEIWNKRMGGGKNNIAYSAYAASNVIYIAGYTEGVSYDTKKRQGYLMALSSGGDLLWANDYGINEVSDELHDIVDLGDSLLVIGSSQAKTDNYKYDAFVFILRKSNHVIDNSRTFYKTGTSEMGISAIKTDAGEIYILGYTNSSGKNNIYIWKLNADLSVIKESQVISGYSETPSAIFYHQNSLVVVGSAYQDKKKEDFLIYKLDTDLNIISRITYGSWENQRARSAILDGNNVIIGGKINANNSYSKACLFKTPEILN